MWRGAQEAPWRTSWELRWWRGCPPTCCHSDPQSHLMGEAKQKRRCLKMSYQWEACLWWGRGLLDSYRDSQQSGASGSPPGCRSLCISRPHQGLQGKRGAVSATPDRLNRAPWVPLHVQHTLHTTTMCVLEQLFGWWTITKQNAAAAVVDL